MEVFVLANPGGGKGSERQPKQEMHVCLHNLAGRYLDLEDHEDDDGDHGIAKGLESGSHGGA